MSKQSAAHYFLEGLRDLGIDYIFGNLGTDHVSIIEELARWDQEGRPRPGVILCPHETVAVHMAGGYALATGAARPCSCMSMPGRRIPRWRLATSCATAFP